MSEPLGYFEVANWAEYQHYKDRHPQWIKLYNALLDNYEFVSLSDTARGQLIAIWLVASRLGNRIPWDVNWLAAKIHATHPIELDRLLAAGFIKKINVGAEPEQVAPDLFQKRPGLANLEIETEREIEGEEDSSKGLIPEVVFIEMPVVGVKGKVGATVGITESRIQEWQRAYPAVDVHQQLRQMRAWCLDNPTKRKTPRGIYSFVSHWLAKEQDHGRSTGPGGHAPMAGGHSARDRVGRATAARAAREAAGKDGDT